jgi:hypothetical protein
MDIDGGISNVTDRAFRWWPVSAVTISVGAAHRRLARVPATAVADDEPGTSVPDVGDDRRAVRAAADVGE